MIFIIIFYSAKSNLSNESRSRSPVIIEHTKLTLQLESLAPDMLSVYPGELNIDFESSTEETVISEGLQQQQLASIENITAQNERNNQKLDFPQSEKGRTIKEAVTDRTATTIEKQQPPSCPKTSDNKRRACNKDLEKISTKTPEFIKKLNKNDNQNNKSHNNSKVRNIRGSKNNAKVSGIGNKFNDGQKKLKSSNDNSRIPRGGISNKSSRINCDKATNQNPVINVSSNGGVNSNCTKSVSVLK